MEVASNQQLLPQKWNWWRLLSCLLHLNNTVTSASLCNLLFVIIPVQYPTSFTLRPHPSFSFHNRCLHISTVSTCRAFPRSQFHNLLSQYPVFFHVFLKFPFLSLHSIPHLLCVKTKHRLLPLWSRTWSDMLASACAAWPSGCQQTSQSFRSLAVYWGSVRQECVWCGFWVCQGSMAYACSWFRFKRESVFWQRLR